MKTIARMIVVGFGLAVLADSVFAYEPLEVWQRVSSGDWDAVYVLKEHPLPAAATVVVQPVSVWLPDLVTGPARVSAAQEIQTLFDTALTPVRVERTEAPVLIVQPTVVDLRRLADEADVAASYRFPARAGNLTLLVTVADASSGQPLLRLARVSAEEELGELAALGEYWSAGLKASTGHLGFGSAAAP